MEDEDRLWKLVHTCSDMIHIVSKNIYCRAVPQSLRRSVRSNVFFDIPEDVNMPLHLFVALHRQLDNVRKVGKVLEKTNQIERSLERMEIRYKTGDFMENDQKFYQDLQRYLKVLEKCSLLLRERSSIMKRILPPAEEPVIVHPIVNLHDDLINIDLAEGETYHLLNNTDPQAWKIIDANGTQLEVASIFLEIELSDGEQALVARLRDRLVRFISSLLIRCGTLIIRIVEKIQEEHHLLNHFGLQSDDNNEFLRAINQIKENLEEFIEKPDAFGVKDFKLLLARIYVLENDLSKLHLEDDGENTNMYIRLVKLNRFLGVLQILVNLERIGQSPLAAGQRWDVRNGNKTMSSTTLNSSMLSIPSDGTFRNVIAFDFEMVESVREDETRITHPWDDVFSDTTSVASSTDIATTEAVTRSSGEIRRRYLIKGVYDSITESFLPLGEAVKKNIILYRKGAYVDSSTGVEIPVERAIAEGKIQVEKTTSRKLREDTASFGMITLKHVHTPAKPFVVRSVKHPRTGKDLTMEQAAKEGILDEENSMYRNSLTGVDLQLRTAIDRGLVSIEEDETTESAGEQSTTTSYAIHGVVDKKLRRIVSFAEAVELGMIDRETGSFIDNESGEKFYPTEAIKRGFYKGRAVEDAEVSKVEPQNKIVVERFKRLRTKWASVRAFMKMAALHRKQKAEAGDELARTESVSSL